MFIKDSVFKKLVKSAWKRNDLVIAHEGGYYRIEFGGCSMQIVDNNMSNRAKAVIVELIGDLPCGGEGYLYGEGCELQPHMDIYDNLFEEFARNENERCIGTSIMVRHCSDVHIVMQRRDLKKFMVNRVFAELVDSDRIDESAGEYMPGLPVYCGSYMAWGNNVMVLRIPITPVKYEIDKAVLSISGDLSFNPSDLAVD